MTSTSAPVSSISSWKLYDLDYADPQDIRAQFFRARLERGVLDCRNVEVVT